MVKAMPHPDEYGAPPTAADTVVIPTIEPDTVLIPKVTVPDPPHEIDDSPRSVARNSAVMALGSIVSRAIGFLRTAAIGAALGAELVGDDYATANTLPNMVFELLVGGVLASVIVPVLVRAKKQDADGGQAFAQRLLTLAMVFFGAATVIAVTAAPLLTALVVGDDATAADRELTTLLAYLLLPEIFFYGMAALIAALLNARGHFAAPMWTPILNNIVVIMTAGLFALLHTGTIEAASITNAEILVLGVGTTSGIVVQALGLLPALRRVGFRWKLRWDFRSLGLGELARLGSWMLLYVAGSQIGVLVTLRIARWAGDQGAPGPAIYTNAFLIFMMANGIVAVSIGTALMPRMSSAAADGRLADLAAQLSLGTRLSAVILMPTAAVYIVLGRPLAVTLFQWGAYRHEQALDTGVVIAFAGLALVPYAVSQLQTFAFYALSDTRVPALVNVPVVAFRLAVAGLLVLLLPAEWIVAGLMGVSAASFVLAIGLGYWLLRRRIGRIGLAHIATTLVKLGIAAAAGAVAAGLVLVVLIGMLGDGKVASMIQLAVGGLVLVIGYWAAAILLRIGEIREVGRMVAGRLRR
ncbi:MAG: murein biosynthesis integral membrane protein MurJ [Dactylosporangium sp.]|nr:murein biosynthesis integral membrane protein MurJ [Dactylosporangium sp.]NNJ61075.1 murein biosynthesis integral membrane protein MurJ [Dactylosporangium sp.]